MSTEQTSKHKKYRETHKEKIKEYAKKYRDENKDKYKDLIRQWKEKNPNYAKEYVKKKKKCEVCQKDYGILYIKKHKCKGLE